MIPKAVTNSYDFGEVAAQLVPLHSRGVERNWVIKQASAGNVFGDVLEQLTPQKGRTVIHVIALGDEEIFGPNRNGDGFAREDNKVAHPSFKSMGHVFRHHQNTDPLKAAGDVIATAHNEMMSRVQLLLGLDNDKCRQEVQAIDEGKDVPVSMGSMQDYDVCSYCNHRARTAAEHCFHIKNMLGRIMSNGQRVYMQNPNPKFFDISLVYKPADRIAYMLRKVASSDDTVIGGHELAEVYGLTSYGDPKYAAMRTVAALYKQVPATIRGTTTPTRLRPDTVTELKKQAQVHGIDHLLAFLHANGWLVGPHDFGQIIGHPDPMGCEAATEDYHVLDELLDDRSEIDTLNFSGTPDCIPLTALAREDLDQNASMRPDDLNRRVLRITIAKPVKLAYAGNLDADAMKGFAYLYGYYKLAFAAQHQDAPQMLTAVAATF